MSGPGRVLRLRTYLTPSIPRGLFGYLARHLGRRLQVAVELEIELHHSGPPLGRPDPFTRREVDVSFLCAAPYIWLRDRAEPAVDLVPVGLVFEDPRAGGRPVYFSDVTVRADHPARSFADLLGGRWGYNDRESLSGYFSVLQAAAGHGAGPAFRQALRETGSHLASIRALRRGEIDAAALDSIVLALAARREPALRSELRVVETLGPWPIQPIVVRRTLPDRLKADLTAALRALAETPGRRRALRRWLVGGVAPLSDGDYDVERRALREARRLEPAGIGSADDGPPGVAKRLKPPGPPRRPTDPVIRPPQEKEDPE